MTSFPFARWLAGAAAALGCAAPLLAQDCASFNNSVTDYILGDAQGTPEMAMHWKSGLVWQRCLAGETFDNDQCTGTALTAFWNDWAVTHQRLPQSFANQEAGGISVDFVQNLLVSGDWRMAYILEFYSLACEVDYLHRIVNPLVFPVPNTTRVWTGSPHDTVPDQAHTMTLDTLGNTSSRARTTLLNTLLVRGGQPFAPLPVQPAALNGPANGPLTFAPVTLGASNTAGTAWGGARIDDGAFQIDGTGPWRTEAIVHSGQTLTVRLDTGAPGTSRTATLTLRSGLTTGTATARAGSEATAVRTTAAQFTAHAALAGSCGDASGPASATAPSADLCATGAATGVTGIGGAWRWGCDGLHGGASTTANACFAPYASQTLSISANPASITVGSTSAITASSTAAGLAVTLTPSGACTLNGSTATGTAAGLCAITASQPGTGDTGVSRYLPASSTPTYITVTPAPVNGQCGTVAASAAEPATGLCTAGAATGVTGSGGQWRWGCNGLHGGADTAPNACTAPYASQTLSISANPAAITVNGTSAITASSTAAGLAVTLTPNSACTLSRSTAPATATGTAAGTCTITASQAGTGDAGASRYLAATSVATHITVTPAPVNGQCGTASGGFSASTPTAGLCSAGDATAVTGTGPWSWSCTGQHGGNDSAMCSASPRYTKIANNGAALPASATPPGAGPDDWACTQDNQTHRIWEVKTTSGLRGQNHSYTWYNGSAGSQSGGYCHTPGRCDTEKYTQDVNAAGLCGATDWRMPTEGELWGIVDAAQGDPKIDPGFFPNTPASSHAWSSTTYGGSSSLLMYFGTPEVFNVPHANFYQVRLVRAGQSLAPVVAGLAVQGITHDSATVQAASSLAGTGWWLVRPSSSLDPAPTPTQVKANGQGFAMPTAGTQASGSLTGLNAGMAYDLYLVAEDDTSHQLSAPVQRVQFTTLAAPVNGACGSSHGGTFTSKPATGLCSPGSAINETGTGPWSWTCQGNHGGSDSAVCTAHLQTWAVTASASPAQGGTAACTPAAVAHGGSASCTATPEPGYRFDHWTGHCSGAGACELSNVTGPRSVSAQFSAIPAPAAPQIDPASGGTTGAARPAISGSAEPGSTVEVFSGATSLGTATADAMTGAWSLTPSAPLHTGPHTLTATATNAGGTSPASAPLALDVALFDAPAGGPRVTITSSINGCVLGTPPAFAPADLAGVPMGATAPLGALAFTATQCANGTLTVQIAYPSGSLAGLAPYKWGPASQGATPGWFPHGTVSGDVVTYAVTDDGTGDGDTASGAISDPHAMLLLAAPGAHAIPALGGGAMALLSLLAAALGAVGLRKRF